MSRITDTKSPRKALLLICEGRNTEPIFFDNFRSRDYGLTFDILPKPRLSQTDMETHSNRGGRRRETRPLQGTTDMGDDIIITGIPPKSWIDAAEKQFDTYEEIWCIFDKDEHPACREAFEKAQYIVDSGLDLHIAFTSIAIEYYFLLHFEYIYKAFAKSECKVSRKKRAKCMLADASLEHACSGDKCVNGYARSKGYWQESKSDDNTMFISVKDKFFDGIRNATLLRRQSDIEEGDKPVYKRNPYTTVDYLISRLLGYVVLERQHCHQIKVGVTTVQIQRHEDSLMIANCVDSSVILNNEFITSYDKDVLMEQFPMVLEPNGCFLLELPGPEGTIFFIKGIREKVLLVK